MGRGDDADLLGFGQQVGEAADRRRPGAAVKHQERAARATFGEADVDRSDSINGQRLRRRGGGNGHAGSPFLTSAIIGGWGKSPARSRSLWTGLSPGPIRALKIPSARAACDFTMAHRNGRLAPPAWGRGRRRRSRLRGLRRVGRGVGAYIMGRKMFGGGRSEEHTSELQSPYDLVCRLLLEKKKKKKANTRNQVITKA